MHYRNGREAKNGDRVIQLDTSSGQIKSVGILFDAMPGNDFCNGYLAPISASGSVIGACLCDCIHADDLAVMLAEKGLDKRPTGK